MAISPQRVVLSTSRLILGWGFQGRRIEWTYFRWDQIQDGGWPPSGKISNGHISGTGRRIDFMFDPRVGFWGMADRLDLLPVSPNPDQACAYWGECDRGRWTDTKPVRPATYSLFSTLSRIIWCHTNHSFSPHLALKCLKRRLVDNWLKQIAMWDSSAQNSCWIMLRLFVSVIKRYSH